MMGVGGNAVPWGAYIPSVARPGVASILRRGQDGITLGGSRITVSAVDLLAVKLIERAIHQGRSLLFHHPDPFHALGALVPAAAHIARMVETHKGSDRRVAVVTQDSRIRTLYRRLGVGSAPLHAVVPAVSLTAAGQWGLLGTNGGAAAGCTLFVRQLADLRRTAPVDLIVIDGPDGGAIATPMAPTIYLTRNPGDPVVAQLASRYPTFALDENDLRGWADLCVRPGAELATGVRRLEYLAGGQPVRVIPVEAPAAMLNFDLFWDDVGALLRAAARSPYATELAQQAFGLFYDLLQLAVPVAEFEQALGPIRVRLRNLKAAARLAAGDLRDLYLPVVTDELEGLADGLGPTPPKIGALEECLTHLSEAGRVTLVVRNAATAGIVQRWIARRSWPHPVTVSTYQGLANVDPTDVAVFLGMAPRWARHVYRAGIAREAVVLTYAGGPRNHEAAIVQRALAYSERYGRWLARPAAKAACIEAVTDHVMGIPDLERTPPAVEVAGVSSVEPLREPDIPPGLWDHVAALRSWEEAGRWDNAASRDTAGSDSRAETLVARPLRISFPDERWVLMDPEDAVIVLQGDASPVDCPARQLRPGDRIFVIDDDTRKTLLAKVLEVAEDIPELAVAAAWVDPWRRTMASVRARYGTYTAFADELRKRGSSARSTVAIRFWCVGVTLGPHDPDDVRRVGELVGEPVLRDHFREVWTAMETFRGAHTRLGARLGHLVRRVGPAAHLDQFDEDTIVDERSGLTISDFKGCAELLEVATVATVQEAVPTFLLGHVRPPEGGLS